MARSATDVFDHSLPSCSSCSSKWVTSRACVTTTSRAASSGCSRTDGNTTFASSTSPAAATTKRPISPTQQQAELIAKLDSTPDKDLARVIGENAGVDPYLDEALHRPLYLLRHIIAGRLRDQNVINEHYKKVDGTSFAAPIVSSVVAQ